MAFQVDFAHHRIAVIDQHSLFDAQQLYPFPGQGLQRVDLALHPQLPFRSHSYQLSTSGYCQGGGCGSYLRGLGIHTLAGVFIPSASCGRLWLCSWRYPSNHACRPSPGKPRKRIARSRQLWKRSTLPWVWGMANPAPTQANPLLHQPDRQLSDTARRLRVPPGRAMVHQHLFRHPTAPKRVFQLLAHQFGSRAASGRQHREVAAMVVEHRQRTDVAVPPDRTLIIHLPELVGTLSGKAAYGCSMTVLPAHQSMPQQNSMYCADRQPAALLGQYPLQFASSPVRIAAPQFDHPLFVLGLGALRTLSRTPTGARQCRPDPAPDIAVPTDIPWAAKSQTPYTIQRKVFLFGSQLPRTPRVVAVGPLSSKASLHRLPSSLRSPGSVKDVPERTVKDVMELNTFSRAVQERKEPSFRRGGTDFPQRLKPVSLLSRCGVPEGMPFQDCQHRHWKRTNTEACSARAHDFLHLTFWAPVLLYFHEIQIRRR